MDTNELFAKELADRLGAPLLAAAEKAQLGLSVSVIEAHGTRRIYVSEAAAKILGYSIDDLVGNSTFLTFAPEEQPRMHELAQKWRNGEAIPEFLEAVAMRKDGTRVPIEVAYTVVDLHGTPASIAFLRDISERKRTEDALFRSESLFRKLVEAAPEAVLVAKNRSIVYLNPRYLRLLGYDRPDEILGHDPVMFIDPIDRVELDAREKVIEAASDVAPVREYRLVRRDGSRIAVECSSLPIDFEGGPAILTFLRDVSERKLMQAQLIQTDRMATVGTLAAGVAHELNNPLAYVLLNLTTLDREIEQAVADGPMRERLRSRVATLQEGAERMAAIVRDLRSFCRPSQPALTAIDMQQILESSINMAMSELKGRARVVRDFAPVPLALADAARLGQVFLNLLLNAAQSFSHETADANEVRVVLRGDPNDEVRVEISDTGQGIPPEIIARIFEPFLTTKPIGIGTGLGLSICQSIVASMRGQLMVESTPGRGSTFRVVLPLARAEAPKSDRSPPLDAAAREARVLVIDDESALAVALKKVLDEDHDVTAVTTGEQALRLLLDGPSFDAIVCDVLMPGTSGMDLYKRLEERRPDLVRRIVFMTGASSMERVAEFFRGIDNVCIDKPVDVPRLKRLIREMARS